MMKRGKLGSERGNKRKSVKKNLLNKLKPFYDLNKINIEFNIKWKLDVDVDYIF